MKDPLDVQMDDPELDQEIRLLSDLMVLASDSADIVEATAIDAVLRGDRLPRQRADGSPAAAGGVSS